MLANPYQQYQEANLETASQGKLLLMLYDGAIRFLVQSQLALEQRRWNDAHNFNLRAQDIVTELLVSLNMDAGDVANNLYRLYEYMNWRLVQANIKRDVEGVREVVGYLRDLREAWGEAVKATAGQFGSGAGAA
jgi:flagellar protein FliS